MTVERKSGETGDGEGQRSRAESDREPEVGNQHSQHCSWLLHSDANGILFGCFRLHGTPHGSFGAELG